MHMPRIDQGAGVPPILAEIRAQGDLAANPQAIERLNQLLNKEYCTTLGLAHAILQDPGLSAKILRVVNSVAYSVRGEPVSTITRAILLLGFERVREIATGLLLMEQFTRSGAGNVVLHANLRRALRCALTAQAISVRVGQVSPEQAYLLGLFANLGLLWLAAYYPAVLAQAAAYEAAGTHVLDEAVLEVTGFSTAKLAAEVLRHWSLPDTYVHHFSRRPGDAARSGVGDRLSAVVDIADRHARVAERAPEPDARLLTRFEQTFELPAQKLLEALAGVEDELRAQARILGIALPALDDAAAQASAGEPAPAAPPATATTELPDAPPARRNGALAIDVAVELTRSILVDDDVNHNLAAVVEGVARSGPYDVVVLALLSPRRDRLVGRLAYGPGAEAQLERLSLPLQRGAGELAEAVLDGSARIVAQGSPAMLVPRGAPVPDIAAASFAVQPLVVRDVVAGALLAARATAGSVGRDDLPLLQMFCNIAAIGLREVRRRG
jgi:HD-like signal output (HDOD) protein